jgi:hypothetical protein
MAEATSGDVRRATDALLLLMNHEAEKGRWSSDPTYTVISDKYGGVVTMHPGAPR